ncbi:MAG: T9SS type A sorting domain-containing protein [Ignavibacteriaceae bacterium]|nr:T9SS type A sorting domain-containing protein [Ignavibacteriaceae bacterium]
MKHLLTIAYFIIFLTCAVFAQTDNAEQSNAVKEGLREQYSQSDFELFTIKEKNGEISNEISIIYSTAAADALVNNNNGSSGTANFTQSETSILAFGNNVVIGFNDSGSYTGGANKFTGWSYSSDGGASFIDGGTLPTNTIGDAGDPVLARNETTGRIYLSTLGFSGAATIQIFRSDDNGMTWAAPINGTPGGSSEDKQWHTVDNFAGAGNGNVYLISRRFGGSPGIYFFRSTDDGNTFGPSGGVNIFSGGQGAFVAVGPDHSVYAFYYNGSTTIQVRKSTDFGVSFGSAVTIYNGIAGGVNGDLGLTGKRNGTSSFSSFRSNAFPHVAVNPVSGHIYVTFNNDGAGVDKGDIFLTISTNGGTSWSAPTKVNDDITTTDQWQPAIAVTPNGNRLGIFYYSRQEDIAENNLFKYYGRIGVISGSTVTFDPSLAISDVASLPEFGRDNVVNSVYMGDYNHAWATNSAFHVVWSDNRDDLAGGAPRKDPNVYYDKVTLGPPCPINPPTNPSPANGTTGLAITGNTLTWTNGSGADSIEVWFGEGVNLNRVYNSTPIASFSLASFEPLNYSTTYGWQIRGKNDTCTVSGPLWSFTTMADPNIQIDTLMCEAFESGLGGWTITNEGGTCVWENLFAPFPNTYTLPATATGGLLSADSDECGSGSTFLSTATLNQIFDFTLYTTMAWIEFDNDWNVLDAQDEAHVEVSLNGGSTWVGVWDKIGADIRSTHEVVDITSVVSGQANVKFRFRVVQPGWDWWWVVDNFCVYGMYIVPVELTSFTALSSGNEVELNWSTATELNNQGFQIERMSTGGSFEQVGFVAGFGTSTEPKAYSFTDVNLEKGNYTYRLKQMDFDGTFTYSPEVSVEVELPIEYSLEQNYPNPFNPSTTIKYSIAEDGFVKLAVYNMLGEEVMMIVNGMQKAGRYEVNFNASGLASGVYVYRIESANFTSSKKLMLMK